MIIRKIVLTGGPCAGKTTALSRIRDTFTKLSYRVLIVPETATELISGGVAPWTCGENIDYQKCQMKLQLVKEEIFHTAAASMKDEKILIVCDRGAMDNKAYMTEEEFPRVLACMNTTGEKLRDAYDAVFHLTTAAKGAEEFYTTGNNSARIEDLQQARELDDRIIAAWAGHRYLRIIGNEPDMERKLSRLTAEIAAFLGEE